MADGDITAVKVLYRHALGGGQSALGVAKNDKILVVGEITATYVSTGISVLKVGGVNCFGLTTLDFLKLEMVTVDGTYSDNRKLLIASYDIDGHLIFIVEDEGAASPAVPSNTDAILMRFMALGDDAGAPVLT